MNYGFERFKKKINDPYKKKPKSPDKQLENYWIKNPQAPYKEFKTSFTDKKNREYQIVEALEKDDTHRAWIRIKKKYRNQGISLPLPNEVISGYDPKKETHFSCVVSYAVMNPRRATGEVHVKDVVTSVNMSQ